MAYIEPEESAFGVGFLERLENNTGKASLRNSPEPLQILESIKRNVSAILNSRTGEAESVPQLGLIDFNDATMESSELSVGIKLAILECLKKYEPRLKDVLVYVEPDYLTPLSLGFRIEATLNSEAIDNRVQIDLLLDQNRHYRVFNIA
ncbi:type VI secretion system baseplate subunit TssE [Vibrio sp. JC009]|uniref:type VI secretion system baseplate subunit TssE n=1 Tax=Vibrio sp. JC009 TaxID=2912314 RepID=UPI0023AE95B5|nr:type VI secretion system baseplate subunit TssE [Vibrio sp. JC009]WED24556.1 type VI secretion system baseplate subunit TssE [Vibrio sp. JC009]